MDLFTFLLRYTSTCFRSHQQFRKTRVVRSTKNRYSCTFCVALPSTVFSCDVSLSRPVTVYFQISEKVYSLSVSNVCCCYYSLLFSKYYFTYPSHFSISFRRLNTYEWWAAWKDSYIALFFTSCLKFHFILTTCRA